MDMCERRGSGIDRATDAISQMKLPAYKAQSGDDYTRITLYPKKKVSEMTREERIAVCYQYACLLYEEGQAINNQIVRERFNLNKNQTVMASRILADALESGLIKMKDPETESRRYTSYIPYYGWFLFLRETKKKKKNIDYQVFPIFTRNHINIFIP